VETQQYQRKPIIVDAVRVTEENFTEVAQWCQGAIVRGDGQVGKPMSLGELKDIKSKFIKVRVINPQRVRQTKAYVGDWVLYSEYNGYKVYTNGAFENAFLGPVEPGLTIEKAVERLRAAGHIVEMPENAANGTYGGAREVGPEVTGI
jgi:hypothetical protein